MANTTLKFGNGNWATKEDSALAYSDQHDNFKPLPFNFSRASNATVVNKAGLIETAGNGIPRIDFLGNTQGAMLLEPQRTNSITYSNDFSKSIYGKINLTITANQGISPDGTLNASLLVPNATLGNRYLTNSTGSNLKINTVFLKKKELRYVKVGNAQSNVLVDLENGTISASSVSTNNFTIENYGNGWYRVSCYNTLDVNLQIQIFVGLDGSGSNIATNGTDGLYIYGFEIENGSYTTSYIPTNGATSTRVVETCNQTPPSGVIGQTEGSIFAEFKSLDSVGNLVLWLRNPSGGSYGDMIKLECGGDARLRFEVRESNVTSCNFLSDVLPTNIYYKVAVAYKQNDFVMYLNGVQVSVDTSGNVPTCSEMYIGKYVDGGVRMGVSKSLKLYDTRLSNSELQELTTI